MNCLEFRHRLVIDPAAHDADIQRHGRECPRCAAFSRRQLEFDQTLRQAVEVKVPEGLASRILLRQSFGEETGGRRFPMRWLARAAGVLVTVGLAAGLWTWQQRASFERMVLAHIEDEMFALETRDTLQVTRVNEVLQPVGTHVGAQLGLVRFASVCPFGKSFGAHLVVQGTRGPVTVIVAPKESVPRRIAVRTRRYEGVIFPNGMGSISIIAEPGEDLAAIEARVRAAIHYQF